MPLSADELKMLDIEQKRRMVEQYLRRGQQAEVSASAATSNPEQPTLPEYTNYSYDSFVSSMDVAHSEIEQFNAWKGRINSNHAYAFEAARAGFQGTENLIIRENGETFKVTNFSSYNYLGYNYHPEVIAAAKAALDRYGLGAASSPVISGTFQLHQQFAAELAAFFGSPMHGASLFSSGYAVNVGTISAYIKQSGHIVMDRSAHMSILEGAQLSRARVSYFRHNNAEHLEQILRRISDGKTRILVCTEGVFSADGDYGALRDIVSVCKRYGAMLLVDEAHSALVAGPNGRGVIEEQNVLGQVDLLVITFSKGFGGIGGALIAHKSITQYINWYARSRMFSCALDPAVTGGMLKALQLAQSEDGHTRRKRLRENADYFRSLLEGKVSIGSSKSWIVPVIFGDDRLTLPINDYLQRAGLDTSVMQFPACPKNEARIRMFVTAEHSRAQLEHAAEIIVGAADHFRFRARG